LKFLVFGTNYWPLISITLESLLISSLVFWFDAIVIPGATCITLYSKSFKFPRDVLSQEPLDECFSGIFLEIFVLIT
jgi:hypothetical protein